MFSRVLLLALLLCPLAVIAQADQAPDAAPITVASAQAKIEHGQLDDGIADLKKLEASNPKTTGLEHALGVALFRKQDFVAAAEHLKLALDANPDEGESVQLLGLSYYYLGRPKDAIPLFERVQSWYPTANVDVSYLLGISYLRLTQYDQARRAFARMYSVPEDSAAAHLVLARMLFREGHDPIAEREAQQAAQLDPKLPGVHFLLGEFYVYKSQINRAIDEFNQELKINPINAPALYKLADAYTRILKWEDAQRLLQRSIWLDSNSSGPFVLMAKVLLKKDEPQLAVRAAQHALQMDPNNYYGHYLLGQSLLKLGKTQEADAEMKLSQQLQAKQTHSAEELKAQ